MSFSDYFSFEELCASDYATRHNISNTPDHEVFESIRVLAAGLERVRSVLSVPMHINSGYRSPKLNSALGGSKNSAHMRGLAADFTAVRLGTPKDICAMIMTHAKEIGFDQIIQEGAWVHIAFPDAGEEPRYEVLTAKFGSGPTTYERGLG